MNIKERILKISRIALMIWGLISLIGVIIIAFFIFYSTGPGNKDLDDKSTNSDVRFVLNWCELGDQRIEKVLNSHVSARSITGDHLDAYAIKITDIRIDEIINKKDITSGQWYRGDQLPKILDEALIFAVGWQNEIPWFPTEENIRTSDFYIYPWSIYCHGVTPTAAELIIIKPTEKIVYYISAKM